MATSTIKHDKLQNFFKYNPNNVVNFEMAFDSLDSFYIIMWNSATIGIKIRFTAYQIVMFKTTDGGTNWTQVWAK